MISGPDLWTVSLTVAGVAAVVSAGGLLAARLLAGRSVATILTVISAVTIAATVAGFVLIAREMFISSSDLDLVMAIVVIAGVAGFAVSLLVGRQAAGASRLLLGAVQEVGLSGEYRRPATTLPAELAGLSDALAKAQQRVGQARTRERALENARRELVAWVSHDLRGPLAGLRAMAEALEDGVVTDPPTVGQYHAQIRRETDRLALMIDDLFELSRIHAGALRLSRRLARVGDLIGEVLASAEPLAQAKGVRLRGSWAPCPPLLVDPAEVGRAARNLVTNAIRHTPPGGEVHVVGDAAAGVARLSVSDSCGGIPPEHLDRVFDVAFRGEQARTPGPAEGAGLGLSIARGIIEAHAGRVGVRNIDDGCQFVIWLPLAVTSPGDRTPGPGRHAVPVSR
jgi:signal transduction histidine kinase